MAQNRGKLVSHIKGGRGLFSTGRAALRPKVLNRGQSAPSRPLLGCSPLLQDSQNLSVIFQAAEGESDEVVEADARTSLQKVPRGCHVTHLLTYHWSSLCKEAWEMASLFSVALRRRSENVALTVRRPLLVFTFRTEMGSQAESVSPRSAPTSCSLRKEEAASVYLVLRSCQTSAPSFTCLCQAFALVLGQKSHYCQLEAPPGLFPQVTLF